MATQKEWLERYSNILASMMDTEVEEIYTEEMESDAGFALKNGYSLQVAPYMDKKYRLSYFDGEAFTEVVVTNTVKGLIEGVSKLPDERYNKKRAEYSKLFDLDFDDLSSTDILHIEENYTLEFIADYARELIVKKVVEEGFSFVGALENVMEGNYLWMFKSDELEFNYDFEFLSATGETIFFVDSETAEGYRVVNNMGAGEWFKKTVEGCIKAVEDAYGDTVIRMFDYSMEESFEGVMKALDNDGTKIEEGKYDVLVGSFYTENEKEYEEVQNLVNDFVVEEEAYSLYGNCDMSGHDYWTKTEKDTNGIYLVVSYKRELSPDEQKTLEKQVKDFQEKLLKYDAVANAYDNLPSDNEWRR